MFQREDTAREKGRKGGKEGEGKREGEWIGCGSEGGIMISLIAVVRLR